MSPKKDRVLSVLHKTMGTQHAARYKKQKAIENFTPKMKEV